MPSYYSQLGRGRGGNSRGGAGEGGRGRYQGRGGRDGRGSTARYALGSSGSGKGSKFQTFKTTRSKAGNQSTGKGYIAATNASDFFQYLDSRAEDLMDTERIQWDIWKEGPKGGVMENKKLDTIGEIVGKPGALKHQIIQHILDTIPTFKNCVEVTLSNNNVLRYTKIDNPKPSAPKSPPTPGFVLEQSFDASDDMSDLNISDERLLAMPLAKPKDLFSTAAVEESFPVTGDEQGDEQDQETTADADTTTSAPPKVENDNATDTIDTAITAYFAKQMKDKGTDNVESLIQHNIRQCIEDKVDTALASSNTTSTLLKDLINDTLYGVEIQFKDTIAQEMLNSAMEEQMEQYQKRLQTQQKRFNELKKDVNDYTVTIGDMKNQYENMRKSITTHLHNTDAKIKKHAAYLNKIMDDSTLSLEEQAAIHMDQAKELDSEWEDRLAYIDDIVDQCTKIETNILNNEHGTKYVNIDGSDEYFKVTDGSSDGDKYTKKNGIYFRTLDVEARKSDQGLPSKRATFRGIPVSYQPTERHSDTSEDTHKEEPWHHVHQDLGSPHTHQSASFKSSMNTKSYERLKTIFKIISTHKDIVTHYHQQYSSTQAHKIPLIQMEHVTKWSDGNPYAPTYPADEIPEHSQSSIYHQAGGAIYTMLTKTIDDSYNEGQRILNTYANKRDGYAALYKLLQIVTPNLNPNAFHISEPRYDSDQGLYPYRDHIENYVRYKQSTIPGTMKQSEVAKLILAHLRTAQVYGNGVSTARTILQDYETKCQNSNDDATIPFPRQLEIEEIATTIMEACPEDIQKEETAKEIAYYKTKKTASDDTSTGGTVRRLVGSLDSDSPGLICLTSFKGKRGNGGKSFGGKSYEPNPYSNVICPACHQLGHTIDSEKGCSFTVKTLHATNYISKKHSKDKVQKAIKSFKAWQEEKKAKAGSKPRRERGTVRALLAPFAEELDQDDFDQEAYYDMDDDDEESDGSENSSTSETDEE